jgi:hypothetical protein
LNLPTGALLNMAVTVVPALFALAYCIKNPRAVEVTVLPFPPVIVGLDTVAVEKEVAGVVPVTGQKSTHTQTRLLWGITAPYHATLKVTFLFG